MLSEQKDKMIKKGLTIEFTFTDLFYAYCASKGIDDPECDIETDEEYERLETECADKITPALISKLSDKIWKYAQEQIDNMW